MHLWSLIHRVIFFFSRNVLFTIENLFLFLIEECFYEWIDIGWLQKSDSWTEYIRVCSFPFTRYTQHFNWYDLHTPFSPYICLTSLHVFFLFLGFELLFYFDVLIFKFVLYIHRQYFVRNGILKSSCVQSHVLYYNYMQTKYA